jgi:hypothetical protein
VRLTIHANDYSDEELHTCWYDSEGRDHIRREARHTVAMMEAGADLDDDDHEYCTTGLEGHTKMGAKVRRNNREKAWFAVYGDHAASSSLF